MRKSVDDFYGDNEDLVDHKRIVALKAEKLGSENPDWSLNKLYDESGKATREALGLKKKAVSVKKDASMKKPSFPRGTKGKKKPEKKPELTGLAKELQEMADTPNI